MNITIIGAGNLATSLVPALKKAGHNMVQIYSRTMKSAEMLAAKVGAEPISDYTNLKTTADIYIISVKDSVLDDVIRNASPILKGKLLIHTAGTMPMAVLSGHEGRYGVFYPMQTFSREREVCFKAIPCFIEGSDETAQNLIETVAKSISDDVYTLTSDQRKHLHLAAIFACNFANHCYTLSSEILAAQGIPFDVMLPLIDETARKAHTIAPKKGQTGPAARNDTNVMDMQIGLLNGKPQLQELYKLLSDSIIRQK